jgi:hypothetical protein
MKVYLISSVGISTNLYQRVFKLLTASNDVIEFKTTKYRVDFQADLLSWDMIFEECANFRKKEKLANDDFVVLLTEKPNFRNWFSACDPEGTRSIFIHTDDWEYYVPCGTEFPVAYEVIENILERLMFQDFKAMEEYAHNRPRGCISDMCSRKQEIILKLRTADICSDCLEILSQQNVSFQLIQRSIEILETVRKGVLYSSRYRQAISDDQDLPFPIAITLRKLKNTQEPLRKFLFLLDHFDSLVRTFILLAGPVMLGNGFSDFYIEKGLDRRPSLGHWVAALQSLSQTPQIADISLGNEILRAIKEVTKFCERDHIVNLRNDRRGHGYINLNIGSYDCDFEKYRPIIQEIEKRFSSFFIKYKLYQVLASGKINDTSFFVTVLDLMGSHPDFSQVNVKVEPLRLEDIPIVNQVYLTKLDGNQWLKISPYIRYSECPECHHQRVLVADGEVYIDPYIGHRVSAI